MKKQTWFILLMLIVSCSYAQINITTFPSPPNICQGDSCSLSASGMGTYVWQPGGLSGSNVHVTPSITTTYTVYGTEGGNTASNTVTVTVYPTPSISLNTYSTTIAEGDSVLLSVMFMTCGGTYLWSPPTGLSSTEGSSVWASPDTTTTYTLTGICSSGCWSTQTVTVNVVTGVADYDKGSGIHAYVDINNNLLINCMDEALRRDAQALLYDVRGRLMLQKPLLSDITSINIDSFARGCYILRIMNNDRPFSKKICKK